MHYQLTRLSSVNPDVTSPATALDYDIPRLRSIDAVFHPLPNTCLVIDQHGRERAEHLATTHLDEDGPVLRLVHASEKMEATTPVALCMIDRLRVSVSNCVGVAGYHALLTRALALVTAQVPWLDAVQVQVNGTLIGFAETALIQEGDEEAKGSATLLAQLVGLLKTLVGEAMTLRLMHPDWPGAR